MKRFFLLLLTPLLALSLSSCAKPPSPAVDFSARFTASYGDVDYAGTLCKSGDELTVTISQPYTAAGIVFTYSDTALHINSCSHSTRVNTDYLPDESLPSSLHRALVYLPEAVYSTEQNGCDAYDLPTPYGNAVLLAENGIPLSLTEPHSGITFAFSETKPFGNAN